MTNKAAARVSDAIADLERALRAYLDQEEKHGVPLGASAESILGECSPWLVQTLLDHLPTLAHPWRVVDMRDGEPTKLVRDGRLDVIATVRRVGQGKRARPRGHRTRDRNHRGDAASARRGAALEGTKEAMTEPIMQFFAYEHLPLHLQEVSRPFGELASKIVATLPRNAERSVALRKLLESKDAAVRAIVAKEAP